MLSSLLEPALRAVLPARCPGCSAIVAAPHAFCSGCWAQLEFLGPDGCDACNLPLPSIGEGLCARCLGRVPDHGRVYAAVRYGPVARHIALRLKYGRRPALGATIARQLRPADALPSDALVVPVPLHRWRLWGRGYNQAVEIARPFARAQNARLDLTLLVRSKATRSLRGLGAAGRTKALQGAFKATRKLGGEPVYLIDDIYASGATAEACARVLQRAGAGPITMLCWARVVSDD